MCVGGESKFEKEGKEYRGVSIKWKGLGTLSQLWYLRNNGNVVNILKCTLALILY